MDGVAGYLYEAEVAIPAHIVQGEVQTLALAARQVRTIDIEYLTGGKRRPAKAHDEFSNRNPSGIKPLAAILYLSHHPGTIPLPLFRSRTLAMNQRLSLLLGYGLLTWTICSMVQPDSAGFHGYRPVALAKPAEDRVNSMGFPILAPIANADPSIRRKTQFRLPTRLRVERTEDRISVAVDPDSLQPVELAVGVNMVTGLRDELRVQQGDKVAKRILAGFRSRWRIPRPWACARPSATRRAISQRTACT